MITQNELKRQLDYDPIAGQFTWKHSGQSPCETPRPYPNIRINGKSYLAHRLAWLYVYGELPKPFIDHINGDASDYSVSNLRIATHSQNLANQKIHKNNSTGFKGVIPSRKRFRARIKFQGKPVHIGVFDTAEEAHAAYVAKAKTLYGEFARAA